MTEIVAVISFSQNVFVNIKAIIPPEVIADNKILAVSDYSQGTAPPIA